MNNNVRRNWKKVRHQVNASNINYFNALRKHLNTLMVKDGIFWKQVAKALWLKDDDLNTHFFHALATSIRKVIVVFVIIRANLCKLK